MNDMFKSMVEKKKAAGGEISPVEKQATDSVIQDLMQFLNEHQGEKLKGLKKVTVASNDPQGLEQGLAKAKEMVASGHDESMEDPMEEDSESPEDESMEGESDDEHSEDQHMDSPVPDHGGHQDPAELMKQIEMLKAQLAAKPDNRRI